MEIIYFILLLLGAISFAGAAAGRAAVADGRDGATRRNGFGALALLPLGLFFWILVPLIQSARAAF